MYQKHTLENLLIAKRVGFSNGFPWQIHHQWIVFFKAKRNFEINTPSFDGPKATTTCRVPLEKWKEGLCWTIVGPLLLSYITSWIMNIQRRSWLCSLVLLDLFWILANKNALLAAAVQQLILSKKESRSLTCLHCINQIAFFTQALHNNNLLRVIFLYPIFVSFPLLLLYPLSRVSDVLLFLSSSPSFTFLKSSRVTFCHEY